jgi:hypothetical protein
MKDLNLEITKDLYYFGNTNLFRKNKIKSIFKLDNNNEF